MKTFNTDTFGKSLTRSILGCALAGSIFASAFAATQLEIQTVPLLKLTGEVGATNQIQYVTEQGQTNAWNVLTNIVLTNSTQYFVDTSATGSVKRYYQTVVLSGTNANVPDGMALIPAGEFTMGDTFNDAFFGNSALPLHTVFVSSFYMDKNLVTKALWDDVYKWAITHGYTFDNAGMGKAPNHPVHTVNWCDAAKWCNARSEKEGRVPAYYTSADQTTVYRTGQLSLQNDWVKWNSGYRLSTEAEWEKAARGGLSNNRFPWGNTITHSQANYYSDSNIGFNFDVSPTRGYHPDYSTDPAPYTSPVGSFAPNGYGLYDMAGNVCEWCWDTYGPYDSASQSDPRGLASGSGRVNRGGCWGLKALSCRVAGRDYNSMDHADMIYGFRTILPAGQ